MKSLTELIDRYEAGFLNTGTGPRLRRQKAENMTVAMVRSIADRRGRNVAWVEKAVKESSSLTAKEALEQKVIDVIADDMDDLLHKLAGREGHFRAIGENRLACSNDF